MKKLISMSAIGFLIASLTGANLAAASSAAHCASAEQAAGIRAFFSENNSLPAIAALRLGMTEAIVASALPADKAVGTTGEVFHEIWSRLTTLDSAMVLVLKGGHVFEMRGPIPPGTASTRSNYFNVSFPEEEGVEEKGFSGHLRPDLVTAIYAFILPGEGGVPVRSLFFYGAAGDSDFGVVLAAGTDESTADNRAAFEEIWSVIESSSRVC